VSENRQSPFFSRPVPGAAPRADEHHDYADNGYDAIPTYPSPESPEWRQASPLAGDHRAPVAAAPEGAPAPKPGVAAPGIAAAVGPAQAVPGAAKPRRRSRSFSGGMTAFLELLVALVLLASIGLLFMSLVYDRYEEFTSYGFWAFGCSLILAVVLNVMRIFKRDN
jgi:hypothetical protein